jgi:hypothetical protein
LTQLVIDHACGMSSSTAFSRRSRYVWAVAVGLLLIGSAVAGPGYDWYRNHPHGTADPHGERMSYLAQAAHHAVPANATAVQIQRKPSAWDHGGCDGGAPGWTRMEIDLAFRTPDRSSTDIDAAMARAGWRSVPVPGGTAVREYQPATNRYDGHGWLFASTRHAGTSWQLELTAAPAEVETHSC